MPMVACFSKAGICLLCTTAGLRQANDVFLTALENESSGYNYLFFAGIALRTTVAVITHLFRHPVIVGILLLVRFVKCPGYWPSGSSSALEQELIGLIMDQC